MKRTILKSACVVMLLAGFSSCKKDEKSRTELITKSAWKVTAVESGVGSNYSADPAFTNAAACNKDDQIVFRTDNTYEENEGESKCDPTDPQVIDTGVWSFQENESKVTYDGRTVSIVDLNENTLRVTSTENIFGTSVNYRVTYSH